MDPKIDMTQSENEPSKKPTILIIMIVIVVLIAVGVLGYKFLPIDKLKITKDQDPEVIVSGPAPDKNNNGISDGLDEFLANQQKEKEMAAAKKSLEIPAPDENNNAISDGLDEFLANQNEEEEITAADEEESSDPPAPDENNNGISDGLDEFLANQQ